MTSLPRDRLAAWVAAYERAWRSAGANQLAELFAAHATYRTAPFEEPHRGLEAIAVLWEDERDGPDERLHMKSEIVAAESDVGVVRVEVTYRGPPTRSYRDLWIVSLDPAGRCIHFEEWPFWPAGSPGTFASGPGR